MPDDALPLPTDPPRRPERLYPGLLGAAWRSLDPAVRRVHAAPGPIVGSGTFRVSRAPGRLMGLILNLARVPSVSDAAQVRVAIDRRGPVERSQRALAGLSLVTLQSEAPGGLLAEQMGILEFRFRLAVDAGALQFCQEGFAVRLGRLRLPLPNWLSLRVAGREGPADGPDGAGDQTTVDVPVTGPAGGLLFAHRGTVRWRAGHHRP